MQAVAYLRVSTDKQSREGLSLGAQESAIRSYCELYGLRLVETIVDRGVSAKSIKGRPGMERLVELAGQGGFEAVVVYKIDRMFRSLRDALETFDLFKARSIQFHSVVEKWDTSTAMGEFAMNMLLSIAQLERRQTSERTRFTLREKKQVHSHANPILKHRALAGKLAVGRAPYGWLWRDKELTEHAREMPVVRAIVQRRAAGASIADILAWLRQEGIRPRSGRTWKKKQLYRILAADYNREAAV